MSFLLRFAHDSSLSTQKLIPKDIEQLLFDQIEQLGLQILKSSDDPVSPVSPGGFGPQMMMPARMIPVRGSLPRRSVIYE